MIYNNYNSKMLGLIDGPGKLESHDPIKLDDYWTIVNIPSDIPIETARKHIHNFLTRIVSLTLPTSYICNLRCDYCFIRQMWRKNHVVSNDVILNLGELSIKHIINYNNKNNKENNISLWGAEPFCNLNLLDKVIDLCINNGCNVSTSTNGSIIDGQVIELLTKMFSNNILNNIQISLDGPKHVHDKHRKTIDGSGSYDNIMKFIDILNNISSNLNINNRLYSFNGTIMLNEDTPKIFLDAAKFFTDKNNKDIYSSFVPVRIESVISYTKKNYEQFIKTIQIFYDFICSVDYPIIDSYTNNLFNTTERIDGLPRCSAMRTALAVDEDGSLVMCQHPLDNTNLKSIMTFGNLLEGVLNYTSVVSNLDYFNANYLHSSICKMCSLTDDDIKGSICHICPPNVFESNENHVNYDHFKCKAFQDSLPIFRKIWERYSLLKEKELKC